MLLKPTLIRILKTKAATATGRPAFVSAASGLAILDDYIYCIADDEHSLACFKLETEEAGEFIDLGLGTLPSEKDLRKSLKADFESIIKLPESNSLLLLPSGSAINRMTAVHYKNTRVSQINLTLLYKELEKSLPELNIEGAVIFNKELILLQRGNGPTGQNALIYLNLEVFLAELANSCLTSNSLSNIKEINLGKLSGVPLSFTDACVWNDKIYFLAVAENSASTYLDGEFSGARLGSLDYQGNLISSDTLDISEKPEGLEFDAKNNRFLIVTDSDDAAIPAKLYSLRVP